MNEEHASVSSVYLWWLRDKVHLKAARVLILAREQSPYIDAIRKQLLGSVQYQSARAVSNGCIEQANDGHAAGFDCSECQSAPLFDLIIGDWTSTYCEHNFDLQVLANKLTANGQLCLRFRNTRYHAYIDALIQSGSCALFGLTLSGLRELAARIGLEVTEAHPHYAPGYEAWRSNRESTHLEFRSFQVSCANSEEASEFFVHSYTCLLAKQSIGYKSGDPSKRRDTHGTHLSVCLIVRDNEDSIRDCLQSVRPWVDEIVVVDTGSVDTTKQICLELGAQVFEFPWCDDFAAARNESLRHASGRWIFWMDSDDVLPTSQGEKLRDLAYGKHDDNCLGYVMQVRCPSLGDRHMTVVDHVKLVRNDPDIRFEHRIHEQILPAIRRLGGEVKFTDVFVVHAGSRQTEVQHERKLERDFRLLNIENSERPNHPFVLFNLGMTCENAGMYEDAVGHLTRSIELSGSGDSQLRKAWSLLVSCLQALNRLDEALASVKEGLEAFPDDAELLFRQAMIWQATFEPAKAVECYKRILELPTNIYFRSIDPSIHGAKTYHNLAVAYTELGQRDLAELYFARAATG